MSNLIKTGNEIGKSLATINLIVFTCLASSLSASGTFITVKSKNEQKGDGMRIGGVLCSVGVILILVSGIRYYLIHKVKGLGALNTALTTADTLSSLF
jgi:hypothetical protein